MQSPRVSPPPKARKKGAPLQGLKFAFPLRPIGHCPGKEVVQDRGWVARLDGAPNKRSLPHALASQSFRTEDQDHAVLRLDIRRGASLSSAACRRPAATGRFPPGWWRPSARRPSARRRFSRRRPPRWRLPGWRLPGWRPPSPPSWRRRRLLPARPITAGSRCWGLVWQPKLPPWTTLCSETFQLPRTSASANDLSMRRTQNVGGRQRSFDQIKPFRPVPSWNKRIAQKWQCK
ncbi:uncharacterized protein LOC144153202 [Haemaphysalis longicornis]